MSFKLKSSAASSHTFVFPIPSRINTNKSWCICVPPGTLCRSANSKLIYRTKHEQNDMYRVTIVGVGV
jgi:hypothetical protein